VPSSRIPNTWDAAATRKKKEFVLCGTTPRSSFGESCVGFRSQGTASFPFTSLTLATPLTYEPWIPHGYGGFTFENRHDTKTISPGEPATWQLYYAVSDSTNLNDWYGFDAALYRLHAFWRPDAYKMPHETALRLLLDSLYRNFYDPEHAVLYYGTEAAAKQTTLGFTGMSHSSLALFVGGTRLCNDVWREAGEKLLDNVARAMLEGPRFPFVSFSPKNGWSSSYWSTSSAEPGYVILCALDNLIEAIQFDLARGRKHPHWENAAKRCCDAWLDAQSPEGACPLRHPSMGEEYLVADYDATNITVGVIASLVEAWKLWGDIRYIASARRAAGFYGALLDAGKLWGGPGDIEALVNSEVPMFYLRSFLRLALAEGAQPGAQTEGRAADCLRWAKDSAAWRLAFQYTHCWPLDFGSQLYRQGWAGLGSEGASAANIHSVCFGSINVPDYLLAAKLFGEEWWEERLRDLLSYATQQYGRFDNDVGILGAGLGMESFWTSESRWQRGNVLLLLTPPHDLGYMSWTTGWSAYGLLHDPALKQ